MSPPPEHPHGLHALQVAFGRNLHAARAGAGNVGDIGAPDTVDDAGFGIGIEVYRNNARQFFLAALERTYPVTQRRVGAEFFRQLAHEYRALHRSRSGDLHGFGEAFAGWLAQRLADSGYEWLADLARLEWACEESAIAATAEPAGLESLSRYDADTLPTLALGLHPSLRWVESSFPIWSVWQANQDDAAPPPVNLDAGAEHCVVACVTDRVAVYRLDPVEHRLLQHLREGLSLANATVAAATDAEVLGRLLGWAFGEGLVTRIVSPSAPA